MNILSYYIILLLTIIFKLFIKLDKTMINAAILGLGWWGKHITETLSNSSLIQIRAACSRTKEKHTQFIEEHNLKYYKNYIDLLSDSEIDAIIIEDYNKGLLAKDCIVAILDIAAKHNLPVYVDPKRDNFFIYNKIRLFKPNMFEFDSRFF